MTQINSNESEVSKNVEENNSQRVKETYSQSIFRILKWWFVIATLVVAFIGVYYDLQQKIWGYDPLSVKLYEDDIFDVDGWSFLHVIFFGMIPTILFPDYFGLFFFFGIAWEVVEYQLSQTLANYSMKGVWEEQLKNVFNDIMFNTSGLIMGILIRGRVKKLPDTFYYIIRLVAIHGTVFLVPVWASAMQYPFQFHRAAVFGFVYYVIAMHLYWTETYVGSWAFGKSKIKRFLIVNFYVVTSFMFYTYTEHWSSDGVESLGYKLYYTKLDDYIPYMPIFWIPYISFFALVLFTPMLTHQKNKIDVFPAAIITFYISTFIMYLFPMSMERPNLEEYTILNPGFKDSYLGKIHEIIHAIDEPNNTFPSLHVSITTICCIALYRAGYKYTGVIAGVLISLSTLFTKQHIVVDAISGVITAFVGIAIFNFVVPKMQFYPILKSKSIMENVKQKYD
mmetsp:Transcript_1085/g.1683  ORF Transcript_1085/g.1683 Transcript_1085/m.1683 type:complete len:451 (+) Transcript_1085:35-1387(+)